MPLTPEENRRIYEEARSQEESVSKARSQWLADIARTRLMIIKVLVGLTGLIIVFGILGHVGQNAPADVPQASAASSPPVQAIETVSTLAPAPAAPRLSPALKTYLVEANDAIRDIPDALGEFGEGNTQAGNDPGLVHTDIWRVKQVGCLARMMVAAQRIAKIKNVPPQAEHLHSLCVELASEIDAMALVYGRGVEQNNSSDIYAAGEHIERIKEIALQSTNEVVALSTK